MPFVERDAAGAIVGRYAVKQKGYAEEFLPDDHQDLKPLPEARAQALRRVNAAFEAAAAELTAGYPPSELLTWPLQESEAIAWRASATAPTPYIDALSAARGIPRRDYLDRVLAKVDVFRATTARLIGARQKYMDLIEATNSTTKLDALQPVFPVA